jgi:hypothetical protein
MEIVLTLIRNLLAIPNQDPRFVTSTTVYLSHLQESLIYTLHQESVYEMILLFTQVRNLLIHLEVFSISQRRCHASARTLTPRRTVNGT